MCMDVQIPDRDQFIVFSMDGQIPAIPVSDVDTAAPTEPTDPARLPIDLYLVVQVAIPDMAGVLLIPFCVTVRFLDPFPRGRLMEGTLLFPQLPVICGISCSGHLPQSMGSNRHSIVCMAFLQFQDLPVRRGDVSICKYCFRERCFKTLPQDVHRCRVTVSPGKLFSVKHPAIQGTAGLM